MLDISLSLERMIEVALVVLPLMLYLWHRMDRIDTRIDAVNARADALWQEFIALKRAEQK